MDKTEPAESTSARCLLDVLSVILIARLRERLFSLNVINHIKLVLT